MEEKYSKDQTGQFVFNAEIKKDIEFIKASLVGINDNIKMYSEQFLPRTEFLEWRKFSEDTHKDFEIRLKFLERYAWLAIGGICVLEVLIQFLPYIHVAHN